MNARSAADRLEVWTYEEGTLEPGFRQATRQWAERLQRAGLPS